MATRALLADLAHRYEQQSGTVVAIEAVGGVDAAKRVQAGEAFDAVFLAADAIDRLITSGHVSAPRVDLVRSPEEPEVIERLGLGDPDRESQLLGPDLVRIEDRVLLQLHSDGTVRLTDLASAFRSPATLTDARGPESYSNPS